MIGRICALFLLICVAPPKAQGTEPQFCTLLIEFGSEVLGHHAPCEEGSRFSLTVSGLEVTYHRKNNAAEITLKPERYIFLDGGHQQIVMTDRGSYPTRFYDGEGEGYVERGNNRSAGSVRLRVVPDKGLHPRLTPAPSRSFWASHTPRMPRHGSASSPSALAARV